MPRVEQLLASLLLWANARPPLIHRREFYALKTALCRRYAQPDGLDLQHIVKPCWGRGGEQGDTCTDCRCRKCNGTGIYDEYYIQLKRWRWNQFVFHEPLPGQRRDIAPEQAAWPIIEGYIRHQGYGRLSNEAVLWLYLLTGSWHLFWREMTSTCCFGRYGYPLLLLQRVCWSLRKVSTIRQCFYCHRRYLSRRGWQICRRCRSTPRRAAMVSNDEDALPF